MSKRDKDNSVGPETHVSTGSTTLNLACTGKTTCGFKKGHYYHLVGDSSSGKTFYGMTCLAEAALNDNFSDYQLIYDDPEYGNLFNLKKYWPILDGRVSPPGGTIEEPDCSATVEDFWDNLIATLKQGPCIYILDSEDVLASSADIAKYAKQARVRQRKREGKEVKDEPGSYGTAKARQNSGMFPHVMSRLQQTGSILIIISQTRDKIGQGFGFGFGPDKTYSGGHALKFYASLQIWLSIKEAIKKRVMGKDRKLGIRTKIQVKKNRQIGGDRTVYSNFYYRTGIDDVGSCIEYLIDERHWKKRQGDKVVAREFDTSGSKEEVAQSIIENGQEKKLRLLVKSVWTRIEQACTIKRENRYAL